VKKRKISRWFRIRWKSFEKCTKKKLLAKTWRKNALFSLLLMFVKLVLLITFFWCIFSQLFQRIRNQREILRFLTPFSIFFKTKIFLGHFSTFFKLWNQTRRKRLKKSKNLFSKCVLDFNFCTHQRVCILYFLKKSQIRCTLMDILLKMLIWTCWVGGGRPFLYLQK
jgi:hypothetical protein